MTPLAAIRAATIEAAKLAMRENDIGSLAPGHFGDLIAVKGDPLQNIRTLEVVEGVIKGGVRIK
jgi:imidazolonepropionase-like amidohydrolase